MAVIDTHRSPPTTASAEVAAPGWLQIVHLLGAQLIWVSVCAAYLSLGRR